ncbi:hypothetical protein T03_3473 [Trichinella britovi]|uniref:Uncharacterized protein n=1 Tax=Trichinella britovi TaxID=45882 RepID=A0A0V1CSK1_TRIBR|nr:hypothetical protein T03_3473 [Trichinella britovi]
MDSKSRSVRRNLSACPFLFGLYGEYRIFLMSKRRHNSRIRPGHISCQTGSFPVAPRCPFPLSAADNLQSLAASVRGCFLTAFFSPHTACTCGTISVRPHSSRASKIGFWSWRGSAVRIGDPRIELPAVDP